jgi:hypothetical protein
MLISNPYNFIFLASAHDYTSTSLSTSPESLSRLSISVVVPPTQKNNKKMKHKQKKLLMDKGNIRSNVYIIYNAF